MGRGGTFSSGLLGIKLLGEPCLRNAGARVDGKKKTKTNLDPNPLGLFLPVLRSKKKKKTEIGKDKKRCGARKNGGRGFFLKPLGGGEGKGGALQRKFLFFFYGRGRVLLGSIFISALLRKLGPRARVWGVGVGLWPKRAAAMGEYEKKQKTQNRSPWNKAFRVVSIQPQTGIGSGPNRFDNFRGRRKYRPGMGDAPPRGSRPAFLGGTGLGMTEVGQKPPIWPGKKKKNNVEGGRGAESPNVCGKPTGGETPPGDLKAALGPQKNIFSGQDLLGPGCSHAHTPNLIVPRTATKSPPISVHKKKLWAAGGGGRPGLCWDFGEIRPEVSGKGGPRANGGKPEKAKPGREGGRRSPTGGGLMGAEFRKQVAGGHESPRGGARRRY